MNVKKLSMLAAGAIALAGGVEPVSAGTLTGTIDMKTGNYWGELWQRSDLVSFVQSPVNQYPDDYYETVLKLNLDPAKSLFNAAIFDIQYDANPWGWSVNIGDSRSNNGYKGDGGDQSNDAELQIGANINDYPSHNDMFVYGNDNYKDGQPLVKVPDIVSQGSTLSLTVFNNQIQWNNHSGNSGNLNSPYLYALDGQSDFEGPVNYDIFAAFNRSIDGIYRPGSGVSQVKITLSTPEPSVTFGLLGLSSLGAVSLLKSKHKKVQAS
jgi:hypothetical protein